MKIGGFQKLSTVDYPGHLCCTIFLKGCNMRCKFCHNPGLVDRHAEAGDTTLEQVMDFLKKRYGMLDRVCISGGEPTLQEGLEDLICSIRDIGYKVKLDTNGTNPEAVRSLIEKGLIDYIAVDVKAPAEKYHDVAGCPVNLEKIKETIQIVLGSSIDYEFRTTFLPDLDEKDIEKIAQSIAGSRRYVVQQFRNNITLDQEYLNKSPRDTQYILNVVDNLKEMFAYCEARGVH